MYSPVRPATVGAGEEAAEEEGAGRGHERMWNCWNLPVSTKLTVEKNQMLGDTLKFVALRGAPREKGANICDCEVRGDVADSHTLSLIRRTHRRNKGGWALHIYAKHKKTTTRADCKNEVLKKNGGHFQLPTCRHDCQSHSLEPLTQR